MNARLFVLAALVTLWAGCSGTEPTPSTTTGLDYIELQNSPIRGLSQDAIDDLRSGAGLQLALAAELNGYPGPRHVLDLADRLGLNASQKEAVQALYEATNQEAKTAGEAVLDAYEAVDKWFRDGAGPSSDLENLTQDVAGSEAALRQVHLQAHIACKDLLTPHQLELYKDLRGYGGTHTGHAH